MKAAVLQHLHAAVESEDPDELEALAAIGEPAIAPLAGVLTDPDEHLRLVAVRALAEFDTPKVVEPLLTAVKDRSAEVRAAAVEALGPLRDHRAVPVLMDQFQKDDAPEVRSRCLKSLGLIGDPIARPVLLDATHDSHPDVRTVAIAALCRMHDQQAAALALTLVRTGSVEARRQVLAACEQVLNEPSGHEALIDLALSAPDFQTAGLAREILGDYLLRYPRSGELTDTIRRRGRESLQNPEQQLNAALLLGEIRDAAAVDVLIATLHDAPPGVRLLAIHDLQEIGDRRAVPALVKVLADHQMLIAATAYHALKRLSEGGDAQAKDAVKNYRGPKLERPLTP